MKLGKRGIISTVEATVVLVVFVGALMGMMPYFIAAFENSMYEGGMGASPWGP